MQTTKWQEFYNSIRAEEWPKCEVESDFVLLPKEIQTECIELFGYTPGIYSIEQQLSDNPAFCIMPFIHLYINEFNNVAPCCHGKDIKKHTKDFDFLNDRHYEQIRKKMQNGERVVECSTCYKLEDNGVDSSRLFNTRDWAVKLKITDISKFETKLRYYDVRNDNLCNLACRTCRPCSSTQLEKEYKELKWPVYSNVNQSKLSEIIDYDTVERVYIAGGEPTLMPEFAKFLTTAIEKNRTDIELTIITNITNLNKNILGLLEQFKNITFTLSLDGYDSVNRYIRWPSDWTTIENNIYKLKTLTSKIFVNVTASMYNITRLYDLIVFLENVLPPPATIMLNQASGDMYYPFNFPNKELAIERLELLKKTQSYAKESIFKEKVDYFIEMIKKHPFNKKHLEQHFKYNDSLDNLRGIALKDYIPELDACRDYLTKQI
jgi:MoaA/NifB/PqqE/SkfB family radical SAM enzyme